MIDDGGSCMHELETLTKETASHLRRDELMIDFTWGFNAFVGPTHYLLHALRLMCSRNVH